MKDYLTHAERMRRIRTERKQQPNNAPGEKQPANQYNEDTATRDRFLRDINRRPR